MIGSYRFIQDGVEIGHSKNLLTNVGKNAIIKYLAGIDGNFGQNIKVGIGQVAADVSDTELSFEIASAPVYTIFPDYANTLLIYKARLEDLDAADIYEVGLSTGLASLESGSNSTVVSTFDSASEMWSGGTWASPSRIGADSLKIGVAAASSNTATLDGVYIDLDGYLPTDEFELAYSASNASITSLVVRMYTDSSNYFSYAIPALAAGFGVVKFTKSKMTPNGSPLWSEITRIGITATTNSAASSVQLEGLRIDRQEDYANSDILVSRSVLSTPVKKVAGAPLDIEYTLDINI